MSYEANFPKHLNDEERRVWAQTYATAYALAAAAASTDLLPTPTGRGAVATADAAVRALRELRAYSEGEVGVYLP